MICGGWWLFNGGYVTLFHSRGEGGWRYWGRSVWSCRIEVEKREEMRGEGADL